MAVHIVTRIQSDNVYDGDLPGWHPERLEPFASPF